MKWLLTGGEEFKLAKEGFLLQRNLAFTTNNQIRLLSE